MNAEERKTLKRAIDSKSIWKLRALERQRKLRLQELRIRDLELSRIKWKQKYFNSKEPNTNKIQNIEDISATQPSRELKRIRKKN